MIFRHVKRKEVNDSVSASRNLEVAGCRDSGRPRMTWRVRLDGDIKDMGLKARDGIGPRKLEMWHHGENV